MDSIFKNVDKKAILEKAKQHVEYGTVITVAELRCDAKYSFETCLSCYNNIYCGEKTYYCGCSEHNVMCHGCYEKQEKPGDCGFRERNKHKYSTIASITGTRNCDNCKVQPYPENIYHCSICPDYDLCLKCYNNQTQHEHDLNKFDKMDSFVPYSQLPESVKKRIGSRGLRHDQNIVFKVYEEAFIFFGEIDGYCVNVNQSEPDKLIIELVCVISE